LGTKYFVAGGAGFIGSNIVKRLLAEDSSCEVVVYDNLSAGHLEYLDQNEKRLKIFVADIGDFKTLLKCMEGCDVVYHLASNPDIAKAIENPTIDFYQGTLLTQTILEAMRILGIKKILYASGSGVYGENQRVAFHENYSPMLPISTYGASKLAGEALICSYCSMFDMIGRSYRFANVVGKNQTHGVAYDFIRKLKKDPTTLEIWGNGTQTKAYIYVDDIIDAIFITDKNCKIKYDYFNVATQDYVTVNFIANIVSGQMNLTPNFVYTGGDRGFKGDVPVIMFNTLKIREFYSWNNKFTSREAIQKSVKEMLENYE
jgi:UDP-glucose 4-epimerase